MPLPLVVAVTPLSAAARAGVHEGDEIVSMNGRAPRDVLEYQSLADELEIELELLRGGMQVTALVERDPQTAGPLGIEVQSALFDQVRTCDNHCEFCFIYQLPPGMRKSLYLKDDDYRLSFLYGNFTTLTRFTEADLERVIDEKLSPLNVSIHATDPNTRSRMLRNRRGATSLRWLRALLDNDIEVHGQIVVCPGVNDAEVLHDSFAGILEDYSRLASVCVVPLGVSKWSNEPAMRSHTLDESNAVVDAVQEWQQVFLESVGHRMVFAADEYFLLADRALPDADSYEGYRQHENGIGMIRSFHDEVLGIVENAQGTQPGFFAWVDGAPADGYRAPRAAGLVSLRPSRNASIAILTGTYGAQALAPVMGSLTAHATTDVRVVAVQNEFFGGNIGVAGLMVGADLVRTLNAQPVGHRYLLPDVCLSNGVFLDGLSPADLPRPVEIVATDGLSLRRAVEVAA